MRSPLTPRSSVYILKLVNMEVKKRALLMLALLGCVIVGGCFLIFKMLKPEAGFLPYTPHDGEETRLRIIGIDEDNQVPAEVQVTLIDTEKRTEETKVTDVKYGAVFNVIVGREYSIIAKYRDSTHSINFKMRPTTGIEIIIKSGKIVEIKVHSRGIL